MLIVVVKRFNTTKLFIFMLKFYILSKMIFGESSKKNLYMKLIDDDR